MDVGTTLLIVSNSSFTVADITVKKMLSETNRYRLMHDATPLGYCPGCADAAQKHADEIASSGVVKPDGKAKYGQIIFSTSDSNDLKNGNYFGTLVPAKMYERYLIIELILCSEI